MSEPALAQLVPPDLSQDDRGKLFELYFRKLARYRNERLRFVDQCLEGDKKDKDRAIPETFGKELDSWANTLLQSIWKIFEIDGDCPILDRLAETSLRDIKISIDKAQLKQSLNTTLFLDITETKRYSSHTRAFLFTFDLDVQPSEHAIVTTLRNPEKALSEVEKQAKSTHASQSKTWRRVGIGAGAVVGGVVIGVTGGLAAPLIGAGLGSVLSLLGVGGTAAGIFATGLASSSVACGALFGAYGAQSTAGMVGRFTVNVDDFEFLRIGTPRKEGEESLAVNICISGWIDNEDDFTAPWEVFDLGPDFEETFPLKWEFKVQKQLSTALTDLIKSNAFKMLRAEIIRRTVFSGLLAAVPPLALLKLGEIVDNPWMKAKALAYKTGKVLATLLVERAFGNRPVTLIGYSLGALVIYSALNEITALPVGQTIHLIDSVYMFGLPASVNLGQWASIRRLSSGRVVNGYSKEDWVLGVLGRVTSDGGLKGNFEIAGMTSVELQGVENLEWKVGGHSGWRRHIGECLEHLGVRVDRARVKEQLGRNEAEESE